MKSIVCTLLLFSFLLAACAAVPPSPTPSPVPSATFTPVPAPTQTLSPTPEAPAIDEHDLNPAYEQAVSQEFMGVQINASLITDKSLDPIIKKVTIDDATYAEFIAKTFYEVWKGRGGELTFEEYMAAWAKAQESGLPEDWRVVEIKDIWANDLADGKGYEQRPYTIWPMFSGQALSRVMGIENFSIALVSGKAVKNVTVMNSEGGGYGTNLDPETNTLYIYGTVYAGYYGEKSIASGLSGIPWWLIRNTGGSVSGYGSEDNELKRLLVDGELEVYP
ncbi:MAG: hypothetical protein ACOYZ8_16485 [Chloroflexota bacterium]